SFEFRASSVAQLAFKPFRFPASSVEIPDKTTWE
ncbi:MAG: hypothetical protein ACI9RZ_001332, partial [Sphingobacteriales bacterium]